MYNYELVYLYNLSCLKLHINWYIPEILFILDETIVKNPI